MRYQRLGSAGLIVSRIGLGMMSYGDPALEPWYLDEHQAAPTRSTAGTTARRSKRR